METNEQGKNVKKVTLSCCVNVKFIGSVCNLIDMLDDKVYDLMMQIVQESKGLHRIEKYYHKDARGDEACDSMWEEIVADKEAHIGKLVDMLKKLL